MHIYVFVPEHWMLFISQRTKDREHFGDARTCAICFRGPLMPLPVYWDFDRTDCFPVSSEFSFCLSNWFIFILLFIFN